MAMESRPSWAHLFLNLIILLFFGDYLRILYLVRCPFFAYGESWIIEDPLDKADAIIVFGRP